jgi:hypothetical protein
MAKHGFLLQIDTYLTVSTSGEPLKLFAGVTPFVCWMLSKGYTRPTKIYRRNITLTID